MEIRLEDEAQPGFRWQCFTCGRSFEVDAVKAVADNPGEVETMDEHADVCPACIAAGPDGLRERMREYIAELRATADDLERLAAGPIAMPSARDFELRLAMSDEQREAFMDEHFKPVRDTSSDPAWWELFPRIASDTSAGAHWLQSEPALEELESTHAALLVQAESVSQELERRRRAC
jgi:hypothetical protein